jgi:hypothetical protein
MAGAEYDAEYYVLPRQLFQTWKQVASSAHAFTLVSYSAHSSTLKMEAIFSSEMLTDFQQTTLGYIPEDSTLQEAG